MEGSGKKRYFSLVRIVALLIWLALLLLVPPLSVRWGWIPPGAEFVPISLILAFLFFILLDKISFRVGTVLVVICALWSLYQPEFIRELAQGLDYKMRDSFFVIRGPKKPSGEVVIVDLDYDSLRTVGQWPWPRTTVAQLIQRLKQDGARVVGFDIVFAEPGRLSLGDWAERFQQMGLRLVPPQKEGDKPTTEIDLNTYTLPVQQIREIVLSEWTQRLEEDDSNFWVNPDLPYEERKAIVTQRYMDYAKARWDLAQDDLKKRHENAGLDFKKREYQPPTNPMLAMAVESRELFFLDPDWHVQLEALDAGEVIFNNDEELGKAFALPGVVAGGYFIVEASAGARKEIYRREEGQKESDGMVLSTIIDNADMVFPGIRKALRQVLNIPAIQLHARYQGMFNIVPDRSGAARFYAMVMKAPIFLQTLVPKIGKEKIEGAARFDPSNYEEKIISQEHIYPALALEMLRAANGYKEVYAGYQGGQRGLFLERKSSPEEEKQALESFPQLLDPKRFIPLDFKGDLQINFLGFGGKWLPEAAHGPEYYFDYVSMVDVLQGKFPEGTFKNKYVIIGSTDPTLQDLVGSPFREAFPGLEVHAVVLDNLIQQDYLVERGEFITLYTFFGILIGGIIFNALVAYTGPWWAAAFTLVGLIGFPLISYLGLTEFGLVIDFVYSWFCVLFISATVILINFFIEGRERRWIVAQFSAMVSGDVLKKLHDDPGGASLGGQKAEISVMFSDLAGFTNISERLSPKELVEVLNEYFTPMTNIILGYQGFIDKFIGDAIMAVWGVPFPDPDHAVHACLAVLDQQEALLGIAAKIKEEHGLTVFARMGVGSGVASAAMMGSETRKNYTVMGDTVNLGARLEPACKDYGIKVMIDENTYEKAKHAVEARCIDKLVVKGKSVPVSVYELMAKKGELPEEEEIKISIFEKALRLHWERQWDVCLDCLEDLLSIFPEDGPSLALKSRVITYKESEPPESWQGEFVRTIK